MKKIKLTFWLIGFGCGMITTSIIGAVVALNIGKTTSYLQSSEQNYEKDYIETEKQEPIEETVIEEVVEKQTTDVIDKEDFNPISNQEISETKSEEKEQVFKEVTIPHSMSASEICKILEEESIVEDGVDFLAYIKNEKKQTRIKSGKHTLPVKANYEELLRELIS